MRLKFTTPSMCVTVEEDSLVLYTIDPDASEGVEVPMSYCAVSSYTRNDDTDSVAIALDLNAKHLYMDEYVFSQGPRYVVVPVRDISQDRSQKDYLLCSCTNVDLCISTLEIISAIENLNGEYLYVHGDNPASIKSISTTMCLAAKAKGIIGRRYNKKIYVPTPTD